MSPSKRHTLPSARSDADVRHCGALVLRQHGESAHHEQQQVVRAPSEQRKPRPPERTRRRAGSSMPTRRNARENRTARSRAARGVRAAASPVLAGPLATSSNAMATALAWCPKRTCCSSRVTSSLVGSTASPSSSPSFLRRPPLAPTRGQLARAATILDRERTVAATSAKEGRHRMDGQRAKPLHGHTVPTC